MSQHFAKALVTGGAGFIGSFIVDALIGKGVPVVVLDNFSTGREKNLESARSEAKRKGIEFEVIRGEFADPEIWKRLPVCESIFHIGAQTSVTASVSQPEIDFASNVQGVPCLMQYVLRAKTRRLLFANTAGALYGEASKIPTPESHLIEPLSPYGATKAFTEMYLRAWAGSMRSQGRLSDFIGDANYFSWSSLRLGNVYGPRQTSKGEAGVVPIFVEKIFKNEILSIFGDGSKTRDYIFVQDVANAFILAWDLLAKRPLDKAYNLSSGTETRDDEMYKSLLSTISDELPSLVYDHQPRFEAVRPGEVIRSCLDVSLIRDELGWRANTSLKEGLRISVKSYLS